MLPLIFGLGFCLLIALSGVFLIWAARAGKEIMNPRKTYFWTQLFGEDGAKTCYMVIGALMILAGLAAGVLMTAGFLNA